LNRLNRKYHIRQTGNFWVLLLVAVLSFSCSNTKYLRKDQALLVSSSIKLHGDLTSSEKDELKNSLNSSSILLQHPNTKFLNIMRLKLWLYNQKNNEKKVGKLWNWLLIDKNMEPPVIYDSGKTKQSAQNMVSYLDNQGYFYASVHPEQKVKSKKASVTYQVNTGKNFIIDSIGFDIPDTTIRKAVIRSGRFSYLKKGDPFKIETLSQERARLTRVVRNQGYFRFSSDQVLFVVDTINKSIFNNILDPFANIESSLQVSKGNEHPKMSITVEILTPADAGDFRRYALRNIYVYPDYSAYDTPGDTSFSQQRYDDMIVRYRKMIIHPRVLYNNILLRHGNLYTQSDYDYTLQRLNALGVWKFVNIEMDTIPGVTDSLDAYVFLTPDKKQELGLNLETTSSSDYIIGGALNLTYRNNNTNRAADRINANLKTGIEWNSDSLRPFYVQAREYSGQANVSFPRFITPFHIRDLGKFSNPSTSLGMGFDYLDRLGFFSLSSINGSFGYTWNESRHKQWILNPFAFSFNRLFHISDNFAKQLEANPFLKSSFSSTFIGGENVSFIYNSQDPLHQTRINYFRANLEESGMLLNGINGIIKGVSANKSDFAGLTSVGFSRYVKADAEYKHYYNRRHSTLVSRLYAGLGVPYGASDVLPYVKQFTAGGPNSLRAWRLRALGPGSYYNPDVNNPDIFPDQTGDMKLEGNLEFRFDIFNLFGGFLKVKGATFVDAGNIWDLKKNPYKPGAEFKPARFYQDIAVGGGFGVRLDFSYAVLRFDFATPFKEPYIADNYGWILKTIKPLSGSWRKKNIVFNLAVGYPF
jgi:outer membrane protein assembly factor BamA